MMIETVIIMKTPWNPFTLEDFSMPGHFVNITIPLYSCHFRAALLPYFTIVK